ncbi:MAG: helix-turn-helix domain-containing protein [Luteitalea sp.]|nr:helix-turn-helix domain-containing protein [Luteitalea sp.]
MGRTTSLPYRAQVMSRGLQILDLLAESGGELGPGTLAARLALHRSTIHRILTVLECHGLVRRSATRGKYSLGMKLFTLGNRASAQLELRDHAEPFLYRLVQQTGEDAHLCILDGTEMLSIAQVVGPRRVRIPATIGRRTPTHCTSVGKALMAFLPDTMLDALTARLALRPYTSRTLTTGSALKTELMRVRERGFAIDNEEIEEGLRCVGAPVHDHTGQVIASISVAAPASHLNNERLAAFVRAVMTAARGLSVDLGNNGERPSIGDFTIRST